MSVFRRVRASRLMSNVKLCFMIPSAENHYSYRTTRNKTIRRRDVRLGVSSVPLSSTVEQTVHGRANKSPFCRSCVQVSTPPDNENLHVRRARASCRLRGKILNRTRFRFARAGFMNDRVRARNTREYHKTRPLV